MGAVMIGHIDISPDTCGGKPHIAGHRITVQDIVIWHERLGRTPDEIATDYQLSLGEIYAALAYYHDHRESIDAAIHADESFVEELRRRTPSRLTEQLHGGTN